MYKWVRTRPVSIMLPDRMLELSRLCSLLRGTAPCRTSPVRSIQHPCRPLHPCRMLLCLLCQQGLLYQWVIMVRGSQGYTDTATRARPENQITNKAKAKRARSASTSRRSPSPNRDYLRGTCTATRPSQASPKRAEHTLPTAQNLEAF